MVSISEAGQDAGGPEPVRPMMMMRVQAEAAPTQIAPGEKDVTVTLSVRFLLG